MHDKAFAVDQKTKPIRPKIVAFDFDATIVEYGTLIPLPGMLPLMRKLQDLGWRIIIHTSRRNQGEVRVFLKKKGIKTRVYFKPDARVYVDDRAMAFNGQSSKELLDAIIDFRPWYLREGQDASNSGTG